MEDAAAHVAARLSDASAPARPECRRDVLVALHHVHVPKFEDAGLLEVGPDRESLRCVADADGLLQRPE